MNTINLNKGWFFHIEDERYNLTKDPKDKDEYTAFGFFKTGEANGFAARRYEAPAWDRVNIPHDYVLDLPYDVDSKASNGMKPINHWTDHLNTQRQIEHPAFPIAWYRKSFYVSEAGEYEEEPRSEYANIDVKQPDGKRYFLQFDGIYRDATVWVNGVYMDRFMCGYLGFTIDITDQLLFGQTNSIAVRVDCSQYDGWWYDGGGIYRDVKLLVTKNTYCHAEDIYIHTEKDGRVEITADISHYGNDSDVSICILLKRQNEEICRLDKRVAVRHGKNHMLEMLFVERPIMWDIDDPQLYELELYIDTDLEQKISIGFKEVRFDAHEGFFLNGRNIKLQGVCIHQDFAGVGIALTKEMSFYKFKKLKEMGVNAIRFAHNPPSPDVLDACDRLGLLVMDETRMFGSSPEAIRQLSALVKRDRNHASLLMLSLGNEEHTVQSHEWGARMSRSAVLLVRSLCPDMIITYGGNNGATYKGINSVMDVRGMNYIQINAYSHPDDYHRDHPDQPVFASEEASVLYTRGCYETDTERGVVDSYGYNAMPWATTAEGYMKFCMSRPYFCGAFMWTGMDYRGEPAPACKLPLNPMGNFGIMDLCGFPKDIYYYYRAHWRDEPLIHLLPHWNFEEGRTVKVAVFTNCEEITIYLNGREISRKVLEPYEIPEWEIPFEKGELRAVGTRKGVCVTSVRRSCGTSRLEITATDCGEHIIAEISAVTEHGEISALDSSALNIRVENARVIGVGNGDPTSLDREHFKEEYISVWLPDLIPDRTIPELVQNTEMPVYNEKNPRFDDKYRIVWTNRSETVAAEEYELSCELEAAEDYEYIEFTELIGNASVFLDGKLIGTVSLIPHLINRRPYRFMTEVPKGKHLLSVRGTASKYAPLTVGKARMGRLVYPKASCKLFHGRAMLVLEKFGAGEVNIFCETENGIVGTSKAH